MNKRSVQLGRGSEGRRKWVKMLVERLDKVKKWLIKLGWYTKVTCILIIFCVTPFNSQSKELLEYTFYLKAIT